MHPIRYVSMLILLTSQLSHAQEIPQNGWIVWASSRENGRHEIYLMKADGSGVQRLTQNGGRFPIWSPDGQWTAYQDITDYTSRVIRWDKSEDKKICQGEPAFWMWDGSGLVCGNQDKFFLADPTTGKSKPFFIKSDFPKIASAKFWPGGITHDGRYMVAWSEIFNHGFTGENGTFNSQNSAIVLDLQNKDKVYFLGTGCEPATAPSGSFIYHVNKENYPDTQIYRMDLKDLATRSSYKMEIGNPNTDWGHEYFPRISNDGKWLVYGASTGCHDHETCDYEIFIHRLGAEPSQRKRLTNNPANDNWPHLYVGPLFDPSQPQLVLNPKSLSFSASTNSQTPPSQTVTISNAGAKTLSKVQLTLAYEPEGHEWLTVTAKGDGNQQQLINTVSAAGLSLGTYNATVSIAVVGAGNSPVIYSVTLKLFDVDSVSGNTTDGDGGLSNAGQDQRNGSARSSGCCFIYSGVRDLTPWPFVILFAVLGGSRKKVKQRGKAS